MASGPRTSNSSPQSPHDLPRVILLMDVDCFEVQVWAKQKGIDQEDVPVIVLNHLDMILSINYEARALGIPKMKGKVDVDELQGSFPELRIIRAELKRGLTDTLLLQQESDKILDAINSHPVFQREQPAAVMERSNNDEIYIDCTEIARELLESPSSEHHNNYYSWPAVKVCHCCWEQYESPNATGDWNKPLMVFEDSQKIVHLDPNEEERSKFHEKSWWDHDSNSMLIYGSQLARAFHLSIWKETGYSVSFGVAHNKMLAKIACEENKPNAVTVLTNRGRQRLFRTLEFNKLPGFKSETGEEFRDLAYENFGLNLTTVENVRKCPGRYLDGIFDLMHYPNLKQATDSLRRKAEGKCDDPVLEKYCNDTIKKSLPLYGMNSIRSWQELLERIEDLAAVFIDKLKYHFQRYTAMPTVISVKTEGGTRVAGNVQNTLEVRTDLPTRDELQYLIEEYVLHSHEGYYRDVTRIWIIASNFVTMEVLDEGQYY